jgi:hypothetical protein
MIGRRGPPSQSWRTFLRNHADAIAAIDLCVVPTPDLRAAVCLSCCGPWTAATAVVCGDPQSVGGGWLNRWQRHSRGTACTCSHTRARMRCLASQCSRDHRADAALQAAARGCARYPAEIDHHRYGRRCLCRQRERPLTGAPIRRNAPRAGNRGKLRIGHPRASEPFGHQLGSGLSGSTGWHNSVRARAYLTHAQTEKGEEPDPALRELIFKKNNYGPVAERILLRWERGVFVPEGAISSLEKLAAEQRVDERFLQLLAQFTQQGRNLSDKQKANLFAPIFAQEKGLDGKRISRAAFEDAMNRLIAANKIRVEDSGPPSKGWSRLAAVRRRETFRAPLFRRCAPSAGPSRGTPSPSLSTPFLRKFHSSRSRA